MTPIKRFLLLGAAFTSIGVAAYFGRPLTQAWLRTRPLPASTLERAAAGVVANADWESVVRRMDGIDMALVPAGCFWMGSTEEQLLMALDSCDRFFGAGRCQVDFAASEAPAHEVCFDRPYWIGLTEVSNQAYGSSSSTDADSMFRGSAWPRETVTWAEAAAYCAAHGARLPSEAEWEFAARGPNGLIYPWGDEYRLDYVIAGMLSPANVGSRSAGASWVGALDMSGGVAEWVADAYAPYTDATLRNPHPRADGPDRVLRGGSWFSFASFYVRAAYRDHADPGTANSTVGIRCARDLD